MKSSKTLLAALIVVLLCSIFAFAGMALAEPLRLKLVSTLNDRHFGIVNAVQPWINEVNEKSGGQIIIDFYNPNTLTNEKDNYSSVESGIIDITLTSHALVKGRFPFQAILELPMIYDSAVAGTNVYWEGFEKFEELSKEMSDVHMLGFWATALTQIHTTEKTLSAYEDMKGLNVGAFTPVTLEIMKQLGASPRIISAPDVFLSLQRNVIRGVICPLAFMRSSKIYEVAKYSTIANLNANTFYLAMNKGTWDRLTPEQKKVFDESAGKKLSLSIAAALDKGALEDAEIFRKEGQKFIILPPEERARWKTALQPLTDDTLKKLSAKGRSVEIYEFCLKSADKYNGKAQQVKP